MMRKSDFFAKSKELVLYVFFGVLTTAVNLGFFCVFEIVLANADNSYLYSNALAWFVSVIFAYITNKLFVFNSRSWRVGVITKEVIQFFGARIFSFVIEETGLWLFVDLFGFDRLSYTVLGYDITGELISKLILAVIVVILNYFFSKFVIFKE
ncbi:MAG: GtrA family protein [bacterium]|nr:GtrA family protein [bacterium]